MNELTRAELVEMICPTSATYDCCQGNCSSNCDECDDLMNYLLDRYDKTIRADEQAFVEKRCKELGIDYNLIYTCNSAD